ncbi:MAG: alpha/beta hydrolase [Sphingomonadales bacterium]|nr:MAG: alpha/beta hydrolase [Sphingomonadales bacterium]
MEKMALIDPPMQSVALADGRQLTWQEFGLPAGRPVLYFHGGGSISLEAGIFHREAVLNNIRLIATNRPGAQGSSLCSRRPVAAYAADLGELLDHLKVDRIACFGESNGGLITMAAAATLAPRVIGAVPINPTIPWFDPLARSVSPGSVAIGYRLMKYWPSLLAKAASGSAIRLRRQRTDAPPSEGFSRLDLLGPPPGIEDDVGEFQWRVMERPAGTPALLNELKWASSDWGFDYYAIPTTLDFYCGAYDAQAPFALVLADRNPDARFHAFSYGHLAFSHPDARRRIIARIASYFDREG